LPHTLAIHSLLDIVHSETKLYLIFEFLDLDLKKYMDTTGAAGMGPSLVKVRALHPLLQILSCDASSCRGDSIARAELDHAPN
jgi:hypothetical protein